MDLLPTEEQEQIIDAARNFLNKELAVNYVRWEPGAIHAPDRKLLTTFAELGWFGLGLPEDIGGAGFGAAEEVLLFREAGRSLVTPMLLAGTIAAHLAAATMPGLTAALVTGQTKCGFAIPARDGKFYLIDAADADMLLIIEAGKITLAPRTAFTAAPVPGIDPTVTFEAATWSGHATTALKGAAAVQTLNHLSLLIAACLTGGAEAIRDMTVAHAGDRAQFGQKIGTFQAVSHPLVEMAVRCDAAFSQVKFAAITLRDNQPTAAFHITAARIVAVRAALENPAAAIQLYGAMGFTAELPVHFFLKRAHLLDQIGGRQSTQLDHYIEMPKQ